jgi:hypothetical protein
VYKLPPIPTPPVTTKAPELEPILTAELVILTVPPINALPANPSPPVTDNAPDTVDDEDVVLVITVVPPIKAFPVIPTPPLTYRDPVNAEDEFINPPTDTPVPVNCKLAFPSTVVDVVA